MPGIDTSVADEECSKAFEGLKEYLSSPKLLSQPEQGEVLQLYLAVSDGAASTMLIRETEGQQKSIYYIWPGMKKGSGAGILIRGPDKVVMEYAWRSTFPTTNNEAEYEALFAGLAIVKSLENTCIWVKGDSKLIMDQVRGVCGARHEPLVKYHARAVQLAKEFEQVVFEHIPRAQNEEADHVSRLATTYYDELPKGVYKHVITHFGVPHILVSDNGPQFESEELARLCENYNIDYRFSPIYSSQCNGQVEVINHILLKGIKNNMIQSESKKGVWIEELPVVLWSLRTTPSHATGETSFNLVYGSEVVLPSEVGIPTYRQLGFCLNKIWRINAIITTTS
ncbi:hypothetical protein LIER_19614 [Lithospermum erythrorhizon]|uniref:Uncharacterized protein n=1 Tax=Lithospermum erythrorhizon TaxID=34254 RepID=A0AAV3QKZ0_LITER